MLYLNRMPDDAVCSTSCDFLQPDRDGEPQPLLEHKSEPRRPDVEVAYLREGIERRLILEALEGHIAEGKERECVCLAPEPLGGLEYVELLAALAPVHVVECNDERARGGGGQRSPKLDAKVALVRTQAQEFGREQALLFGLVGDDRQRPALEPIYLHCEDAV